LVSPLEGFSHGAIEIINEIKDAIFQLRNTCETGTSEQLTDVLQSLLLNRISGLLLHGDVTSRLSGKPHIFFIPDIPNSAVLFV
jgi:hypothetical protein